MIIGLVVDELFLLGVVNVEIVCQVIEFVDIIFIMVLDMLQVEDVLFGEYGCVKILFQGKIIVDMSFIFFIEIKCFVQCVNEMGVDYLDVLVFGGEIGVCEGILLIMVGGEQKVFDCVKLFFDIQGKNIILVGGNGDG